MRLLFPPDTNLAPLSPDPNSRKCRARFGLDQQQMWCGPCRCVLCFSARRITVVFRFLSLSGVRRSVSDVQRETVTVPPNQMTHPLKMM